MKKGLKVAGALVLAVAIGVGGYFAGRQAQQRKNNITSAMPKQAVDVPNNPPQQDGAPQDADVISAQDLPASAPSDRTITKLSSSAVNSSWSKVSSNSLNGDTITLYTSAEKDDKGFLWDDSQKWVLEIADKDGGYYTLYDQLVSNGMVYYDVSNRDNGDVIITVYTLAGAGTNVIQYTETSDGYTEKSVYNSGAVNKLFSSIPDYR